MSRTILDGQSQTTIIEPRALENRGEFADVVHHTAIAILAACFLSTRSQYYSLGPLSNGPTVFDHLAIRCP